MLGLDAAGKTTILYKLHIGEVLSTVPTIGMLFLKSRSQWCGTLMFHWFSYESACIDIVVDLTTLSSFNYLLLDEFEVSTNCNMTYQ